MDKVAKTGDLQSKARSLPSHNRSMASKVMLQLEAQQIMHKGIQGCLCPSLQWLYKTLQAAKCAGVKKVVIRQMGHPRKIKIFRIASNRLMEALNSQIRHQRILRRLRKIVSGNFKMTSGGHGVVSSRIDVAGQELRT